MRKRVYSGSGRRGGVVYGQMPPSAEGLGSGLPLHYTTDFNARAPPPAGNVVDTLDLDLRLSLDGSDGSDHYSDFFREPSFASQNVQLPEADDLLRSQVFRHNYPHPAGAGNRPRAPTVQSIPDLPVPFPDPRTDPLVSSLQEDRELGRGSFGRVVAADAVDAHGNPVEVAKKIMLIDFTDEKSRAKLMDELRKEVTMIRLVAPYKIYNAYLEKDPQTGTVFVVLLMELIHGSDGAKIPEMLGRFLSPKESKDLFEYLLSVAGCMDSLGAVHRDIKPPNLVYKRSVIAGDKDEVVLVDWGLGCRYVDPATFPRCNIFKATGTPVYVSPYMWAALSAHPDTLANLTRRIMPCLSEAARAEGAKALQSNDIKDFETFLKQDEVNHLLLRMNDLWAIALTVMDMAGVDFMYFDRSSDTFHNFFQAQEYHGMVEMLTPSREYLTLMAGNLMSQRFDRNMVTQLIRIVDYGGELEPVECPSAANLLAGLYGRTTPTAANVATTKNMCAVTRRQAKMPDNERRVLTASHNQF